VSDKVKRPWHWWLLVLVLAIQALNASGGGLALILAPEGSILQVNTELLAGSPFSTFLIPGLILLLVLGLLPLYTLYGLITRKAGYIAEKLNLYPERHWSWTFTIYIVIMALIWIFTELLMLKLFDPLMSIVGLWSVLILILALTPAIMRYYLKGNIN